MKPQLPNSKRFIFLGIIIIALGITFSTTMTEHTGSLGTVFIAVGGLFFIIGMHQKRKEDHQNSGQ